MLIPVGEWTPDASDFGNPGSPTIENALPGPNAYLPMPSLAVTTDALDAYPRGARQGKDYSGNNYQYAGDAAKLYELSSGSWADVSISGGYSTGSEEIWEFARWKNTMIATNYSDNPQQITFGGTNFANLTTALRFRHVAVVRSFVVAGNTFDSVDGQVRDRVRWSAFDDETDWTVSSTTGADFRDLGTGGAIQRVIGGEYGVILSESSIFRLQWAGAPTWLEATETIPGIGILSPGCAVQLGDTIYIWSDNGFFAIRGGTQETPIGAGKVDTTLRADLDGSYLHRISSVADPRSGRVFWAYPGAGNTGGRPNRIVCYDTKLNKWSRITQDVELIWSAGGEGTTLEQLDSVSASLDALGVSLDSSQWKGGLSLLSAFDSDYKSGNFTGSPMTATIELKEVQLNRQRLTTLKALNALVDGGTTTIRVGTRNAMSGAASYSDSLSERTSGRFTCIEKGLLHRIEMTISGAWSKAIGVLINPEDARPSERRG